MIDTRQVMHDIERCISYVPDACRDCSHDKGAVGFGCIGCMKALMEDAHAMLKEQPEMQKKPKAIKPICKIIFDIPYYFCGDCKTMLNMYSTKAKFCSQCGQAVQWE